jgi:predicted nucleic acid-binding protein
MTDLRFLDTNILLYSNSRDPTEATKHDRAVDLIDAGNNALSEPVLQEFYVQATRPTRPDALPHDIAAGLIRTWLRVRVQEISVPIMGPAQSKLKLCIGSLIGMPPSSLPLARWGAENCIPKT